MSAVSCIFRSAKTSWKNRFRSALSAGRGLNRAVAESSTTAFAPMSFTWASMRWMRPETS